MLSLMIRYLRIVAVMCAQKFVLAFTWAGCSTVSMLKQTCTVETSVVLCISILFARSFSKFVLLRAFSSWTGNTSFSLAVNLGKFPDFIVHYCGTVLVGCLGVLRNSGAISDHTDVCMLFLVAFAVFWLPRWWEISVADELFQSSFGIGVTMFQMLFSEHGSIWNSAKKVVWWLVSSANCVVKTTLMSMYTATCVCVSCDVRPETSDFMLVFGLAFTWNSRVASPMFYTLLHFATRYS